MTLPVAYGARLVGAVDRGAGDQFTFTYDPTWLAAPDGFPISLSLPLQAAPFTTEVAHSYFANLLPEGEVRTLVARRLGLSVDNDHDLLAAIGGECAGALTVGAASAEHGYVRVTSAALERYVRDGSALPSVTGVGGVRLSLAGAQDKLAVLVDDRGLHVPRGTAASTHILKLPNARFPHLPVNEALTSAIARGLGLPVCASRLYPLASGPALLAERYDRVRSPDGAIVRLHQEDLCQALGVGARRKYQAEGGPSFGACYRAVIDATRDPVADGRALLQWIAFCATAGNADGHAKNLALVRNAAGHLRLAPFYDLVCTAAYPRIHRHLAMSVGAIADPGRIRGEDWRTLARDIGVRPAYVIDVVADIAERIVPAARGAAEQLRDEHGDSPAVQMVVPRIRRQARRTRALLAE